MIYLKVLSFLPETALLAYFCWAFDRKFPDLSFGLGLLVLLFVGICEFVIIVGLIAGSGEIRTLAGVVFP